MNLRFAPNLFTLWAALPLADWFERAAEAGFDTVTLRTAASQARPAPAPAGPGARQFT